MNGVVSIADGVRISGFFCDDIRQEVNGKTSLIGCYSADMLVNDFPFSTQKLCVYLRISVHKDVVIDENIKIVVMVDGEESPRLSGELPKDVVNDRENFVDFQSHIVVVEMQIAPLTLEKPTSIRVRAKIGNVEIRGLAIAVRKIEKSDLEEMTPKSAIPYQE